MKEGYSAWIINDSIYDYNDDSYGWITSGRATNSPPNPETGPSLSYGTTRWWYWTMTEYTKGNISVTCIKE